jgi:hypothetical protein
MLERIGSTLKRPVEAVKKSFARSRSERPRAFSLRGCEFMGWSIQNGSQPLAGG